MRLSTRNAPQTQPGRLEPALRLAGGRSQAYTVSEQSAPILFLRAFCRHVTMIRAVAAAVLLAVLTVAAAVDPVTEGIQVNLH